MANQLRSSGLHRLSRSIPVSLDAYGDNNTIYVPEEINFVSDIGDREGKLESRQQQAGNDLEGLDRLEPQEVIRLSSPIMRSKSMVEDSGAPISVFRSSNNIANVKHSTGGSSPEWNNSVRTNIRMESSREPRWQFRHDGFPTGYNHHQHARASSNSTTTVSMSMSMETMSLFLDAVQVKVKQEFGNPLQTMELQY